MSDVRPRRAGRLRVLDDPATQGRLRLFSGIALFAFVVCHLLNHTLGLVSLETMERGRGVLLAPWQNPVGEVVLLAALLVHVVTSLAGLWRRRSLRMPAVEIAQLALGVAIPIWLTVHVLGTAVLEQTYGFNASYAYILDTIWPAGMLFQSLLLAVVWAHGAIGVHRWLRLKRWYEPLRPMAVMLAFLVPALALAGTFAGAREWAGIKEHDPAEAARTAQVERWPGREVLGDRVYEPAENIERGLLGLVALVLVARAARWAYERRRTVRLTYPGGRNVRVPRGVTVLEASRMRGVPHASVCGGRGRCSTCRVRIGTGAVLDPPSAEELKVLSRIRAAPDVRLACQLRPAGDLAVTPLMPADVGSGQVMQGMDPSRGIERTLTVLFADLRGFTRLAEGRLPYDVVFILNRYAAAMGTAIERSGGHVDKFIGDGIMAWFGLRAEGDASARQAVAAARAMGAALDELNRELAIELDEPLRMGIGLHLGPAIVGEVGYGGATGLTAIGDTVNVASRLEALSKELASELVISEAVARAAGLGGDGASRHAVPIRGRAAQIEVLSFRRAIDLELEAGTDAAQAGWSALRTRLVTALSAVTGR